MPAPTSPVKRDRSDPPHAGAPASHLDSPGDAIWPHGKFRGQRLRDLPDWFIQYIAENTYDLGQLALVEAELADRNAELYEDTFQVAEPSGRLAEHVLPLVTWQWEQAMRSEFGDPDPASEAAFIMNRGTWILRDICSAHTGRRFPTDAELGGEVDGADR